MTASGVHFTQRMMRLARRIAPFRRRPRRKIPEDEIPVGPKLAAGRGWLRRRPRKTSLWDYCRIVFWTLVVLGLGALWSQMFFVSW